MVFLQAAKSCSALKSKEPMEMNDELDHLQLCGLMKMVHLSSTIMKIA